jgi:hypothetical protein
MQDQSTPCACGIPNKANWHTLVILGRDVDGGTETTYTDIYSCAQHFDADDTRAMLRWDGNESWNILEVTHTELVRHSDYPHEPGRLYGCPACEARCHCTPGTAECVYSGDHSGLSA